MSSNRQHDWIFNFYVKFLHINCEVFIGSQSFVTIDAVIFIFFFYGCYALKFYVLFFLFFFFFLSSLLEGNRRSRL